MFTRSILAILLGLSLVAGQASAQVAQPESLTPPQGQAAPQPKTPSKPGVIQDGEDEIVVIPGPNIGPKPTPQITPKMLSAVFIATWQKIGKGYTDTQKLRDWDQWPRKYLGKINTLEELDAAIKDMVGSLNDRWTKYTSPADIVQAQQNAKDGKMSIGMLLRPHSDGKWHIDGMQYLSPAQKSTLREGDVISSINGVDIAKMTATDVSKALTGKEGEKVSVVAFYDNAEHTVELTFAQRDDDTIQVGMLPGNIAYARLPTFVEPEAVQKFIQALGQLYMQAAQEGQEINGLIFDLRYNSGGLVTMALNVSGMFLEQGTIVKTTTRQDRMVTDNNYRVEGVPPYMNSFMPPPMTAFQNWLRTVPLVVLTNGSTASASEITTGALQDNGRAFVVGSQTFGKAVGFTQEPMPNGGVLQVTNLSYLTPAGKNIADTGITPNKVVEVTRGTEINGDDDAQLMAGHQYLLEIVKKRAEQLAEARNAATTPSVIKPAEKPFVLHGLYVAAGIVGGLVALLIGSFAATSLRRRFFRRRG